MNSVAAWVIYWTLTGTAITAAAVALIYHRKDR